MRRRRPRVVILVENLPVPLDRRVWLEAMTLRDAGWDVVVIGPRGGRGMHKLHERIDDIEVLRYPQRAASGLTGYVAEYLPSIAFTLIWLLRARLAGPVDVIHGCNPPDLFWVFGRLGRLWGASYVYDQHDPNPELSLTKFGNSRLKGKLLYRLTTGLEAASYRTAALVLTVNETCREIVLTRGRIPPEHVVVVQNAPDVAALRLLADGIVPEGRRVGYIGVMGTHDGLDVLLDAWRMVKDEPDMADAHLDLIGDGPARAPLERHLTESALNASMTFHGFLPPAVYAPILARCMIGVSPDPPTPFNDLASMVKIVDYMAIGRGCVAFDLTETRRLGGDSLRVAAPANARGLADAMVAVLRNPDEARHLGDLARKRMETLGFDWAPYGRALASAYSPLAPDAIRADER